MEHLNWFVKCLCKNSIKQFIFSIGLIIAISFALMKFFSGMQIIYLMSLTILITINSLLCREIISAGITIFACYNLISIIRCINKMSMKICVGVVILFTPIIFLLKKIEHADIILVAIAICFLLAQVILCSIILFITKLNFSRMFCSVIISLNFAIINMMKIFENILLPIFFLMITVVMIMFLKTKLSKEKFIWRNS